MAALDRDKLKQVVFIGILTLMGLTILWKLEMFLSGFLGAVTLYVLLRKTMLRLTEKHRWNKALAAITLILASYLLILTPIGTIIQLLLNKLASMHLDSNHIQSGWLAIIEKVREVTGIEIVSGETFGEVKKMAGTAAQSLINTTYSLAMNALMLCFVLYFMLTNIRTLDETVRKLIPLSPKYTQKVIDESTKIVVSNAVGIPLIAIVQGILASAGYYIFGVEDALFWGIITGMFSIVPIIGTAAIWVPLSVFLLATADLWQGVGLVIYSVVLVTGSDNLVRFLLQKKMANIHPLITVLGVILGIKLFGFLGIIFGPLLLSMFILLFRIYRFEYLTKDKQHAEQLLES